MAKSKKPSAGAKRKTGGGRKGVTLPDIPKSVADATGTPKVAAAKASDAVSSSAKKAKDVVKEPRKKEPSKITDAVRAEAKAAAAKAKSVSETASKKVVDAAPKAAEVKSAAASATAPKTAEVKTPAPVEAKVNTPSSLAKAGTASAAGSAAMATKSATKADTSVIEKAGDTQVKSTVPSEPARATPAPVAAQPVPEKRSGVFLPVALGVGGAAVLGFLTSEFNWFGLRDDGGNTDFAAEISRQQEEIDALKAAQAAIELPDVSAISGEVSTLAGDVETLKTDLGAQITGVETKIGEVTSEVGNFRSSLTGVEERIADVEKRQISGDSEAGKAAFEFYEKKFDGLTATVVAQGAAMTSQVNELSTSVEERSSAMEERFDGLQASVQEQGAAVAAQKEVIDGLVAEAKSAEDAAAEAAKVANIQVAVAKITSAVNKGEPFALAIAELEAAGATDIPAVLTENAEEGVPSIDTLKADFPDAANAALQVARQVAPSEEEAGVGGFLKRQLGARSVVPREGNSPNAVLSRAEEAVRNGALDKAFAEIDALPDEAKEKLQDWLASAQARQAAETAVQDLSQSLMAN